MMRLLLLVVGMVVPFVGMRGEMSNFVGVPFQRIPLEGMVGSSSSSVVWVMVMIQVRLVVLLGMNVRTVVLVVIIVPITLDHVRCLFRNHDRRGVGVARYHVRHDGGVHYSETGYAIDPEKKSL